MAAKKNVIDLKLQVCVENGTSANGNAVVKNVNFNNVKLTASDQELYDAGKAVASLLSHPLHEIRRVDTSGLTDEA